jgi:hypothetical protein
LRLQALEALEDLLDVRSDLNVAVYGWHTFPLDDVLCEVPTKRDDAIARTIYSSSGSAEPTRSGCLMVLRKSDALRVLPVNDGQTKPPSPLMTILAAKLFGRALCESCCGVGALRV